MSKSKFEQISNRGNVREKMAAMKTVSTSAISLAALMTMGCSAQTATLPPEGAITSEQATFEIELVTGGLASPWGMAFLPDDRMLVTELSLIHI